MIHPTNHIRVFSKAGSPQNVEARKNGQRLLLSLIAVVIIYANVAVIFNHPLDQLKLRELPLPQAGQDAFLIFGVFSYYETTNQELLIRGLATDPHTRNTYWKQLPTWDYFPFSRGEQNSRMWASRQYRTSDTNEFWAVLQLMGRRIKERYNQRNPQDPISKVSFESLNWPRSAEGFHARQSPAETTRESWIIAE